MDEITKHILQLENILLTSEIRRSPQKIAELLVSDFTEITASGVEYHYKNGDVFQAQDDNSNFDWEIVDFMVRELSTDCILVMYKLVKHRELDESKKNSFRSSVWKHYESKWKIVFHQGTPTSQ
ncbi:DUF4440 domain-containing protein [Desulfitobacterium metallireducens]|uniref:DUF4440 domain-containing protein n=1 Tax=Desulfitobacterium metallireducens DSM 15288 TaxID=871968 RepID=W0EAB7_9FIRM|nr:DUF4440 domain-containing protein [Desulfitobacterium metallireducens]AHF06011.1 hypothetical protein DESME_02230 [Desulfitobacterium metallireducens DSM 15288]